MGFEPTPDEIADRYAAARSRVVELATDLPTTDLATVVPGTPAWTVHALLSHMVGCAADMAAGRFEGAGGEEWTQRQVDARSDHSVKQLLAEWETVAPTLETAVRAGSVPAPAAFDLITHEADLRGAIGAPQTPDSAAVRFIADGFGTRAYKVASKAELAPLRLVAFDTGWSVGADGGVTASATEYEWARALAGRRSTAQVSGYEWDGDPSPYLDLLSPFGPLRSTDCTG